MSPDVAAESTARGLLAISPRDAAVAWLLGRINYERTVEVPYNERQLKLDRMRQLLTRLGQPDAGLKIVHVAGTKGKGSTSAMIAGILTAAGYRTGLFTSPHLERIEERFAVDGEPCSAEELVALVDRVRSVVDVATGGSPVDAVADEAAADSSPTFFEIVTAIALLHFAERQVDAAVLEVGLGGRLDSTNVCLPAVSVITNISFDHMKQLGNTLAAIAREKAGIIKPGAPVVSGVTDAEPQAVIAEIAREHGCRLIQLGRDFEIVYGGPQPKLGTFDVVSSPTFRHPQSGLACIDFTYNIPGQEFELTALPVLMRGRHQAANAAVALATIAELRHQGWCISVDAIRRGLGTASLPGRVELIPGDPMVVLDVSHNAASARALGAALAELPPHERRTLILSISRDKDARAIAAALTPHFDRIVVTQYQENPRAIAAEELAHIVQETLEASPTPQRRLLQLTVLESPADAWQYARSATSPGDLVCITGSFFLAAEMRSLIDGQKRE